MTQIHQEITVGLKSILTHGLLQETSMLVFRRYMNDHNIPVKNQLYQMMVTHVDMLRLRVRRDHVPAGGPQKRLRMVCREQAK